MTTRVNTLTVILDREYREDDVEAIVNTLRMVRGVHNVELGELAEAQSYIAQSRYRQELGQLISELALSGDPEFIEDVRNAKSRLSKRRGW